ncbi:hypothetical protein F5888DRAFT_1750233, partial [Russula emetica]
MFTRSNSLEVVPSRPYCSPLFQRPFPAVTHQSPPRPLFAPKALYYKVTPKPSRGREGYARLRVLWTKPGRADAPRVLSMSCSVLGIQGTLTSLILEPVYIYAIVLGEVDDSMREQAQHGAHGFMVRREGVLQLIPREGKEAGQ